MTTTVSLWIRRSLSWVARHPVHLLFIQKNGTILLFRQKDGRWTKIEVGEIESANRETEPFALPAGVLPAGSVVLIDGPELATFEQHGVIHASLSGWIRSGLAKEITDEQPLRAVATPTTLLVASKLSDDGDLVYNETLFPSDLVNQTHNDRLNWMTTNRVMDLWERETGAPVPAEHVGEGQPVSGLFLPGLSVLIQWFRSGESLRKTVLSNLIIAWWLGPGLLTLLWLILVHSIISMQQSRLDELTDWELVNRSKIMAYDNEARRAEAIRMLNQQFGSGIPLTDWLPFHSGLNASIRIQSITLDRTDPKQNQITGFCTDEQSLTAYVRSVNQYRPCVIDHFRKINPFAEEERRLAGTMPYRFVIRLTP